ncbi:13198_t:CDS:2 [Ambispora leptoticha]|uniref:ethanolamine kinase n=1 Tax=Ambispora leptoticha TaxID=144679 RepID=A0A9N9EJE6_9GLOM|nr:13198_t:CDS:2 [Ambispora leptoticha]
MLHHKEYPTISKRQNLEKFAISNNEYVNLDISVDLSNLIEGVKFIVLSTFNDWKEEELEFSRFNDVVRCRNKTDERFEVVIRVYGKDSHIFVDRGQEIRNLLVLSKAGLSTPLYAKFKNGLVYGFVPGKSLTLENLKDPFISAQIAKQLAKLHKVNIKDSCKEQILFRKIYSWLNKVPEKYTNPKKNKMFHQHFNLKQSKKRKAAYLECEVAKINSPIVFCHNDLLYTNIIYQEPEKKVSFIDYEHGSFNYRGFDIGLHFINFAGFHFDYSLYPKKDFQLVWLRHYLVSLHPEINIIEEQVDELYREVSKFALVSLFYCSVWVLVIAEVTDLDFMQYAIKAMTVYYRQRDEIFAL